MQEFIIHKTKEFAVFKYFTINVESSTDLVCLSSMKVLIVCKYFIVSFIAFKMNKIMLFMSNADLFSNLKKKMKNYLIFNRFLKKQERIISTSLLRLL